MSGKTSQIRGPDPQRHAHASARVYSHALRFFSCFTLLLMLTLISMLISMLIPRLKAHLHTRSRIPLSAFRVNTHQPLQV